MDVDIYKAKKNPGPREKTYIFVKTGSDIDTLPKTVKDKFGELLFFRKLTIAPGEKRIALDPDEAIRNIEQNNYHVQGTKIGIQMQS